MKFSSLVQTALCVVPFVFACGDSPTEPAAPPDAAEPVLLEPPPEGQGFQLTMKATAPAGEEVWLCDVVPLPSVGTGFANVNRVRVRQNEGTHHLTLSVMGLGGEGPELTPGRYDCEDLYGNSTIMENQVMIYGNQGTGDDELQLPEGVAATLPGGLMAIHEIHFVNTTDAPIELYSYVNAWTIRAPRSPRESGAARCVTSTS